MQQTGYRFIWSCIPSSMNDHGLSFKYTARGAAYWSIAAVFLGLVIMEGMLFVGLSLLLLPGPAMKWSVAAAVFAVLVGLPLRVLFAPLFTRHRLTGSDLVLHYGLHEVSIPRRCIRSAVPIAVPVEPIQVLGARTCLEEGRAVACFSGHGQILLSLTEPLTFPQSVIRHNPPVDKILFNVDDRDALLAAIGAAEPEPALGAEPSPARELKPAAVRPASDAAPGDFAIRTELLSRDFGQFRAVDSLVLQVRRREIYGFLGLNGAGKTTTMKMLVGLLRPTEGRALVDGHDVWKQPELAKAALGYVPDKAILYERLSGREFLEFLAQLRGLDRGRSARRIDELLALLDLERQMHLPCGSYSFGMKRKLSLAGALLHAPPVLILDEPFNGLDPRGADRLKQAFAEMVETSTIFLSTHDLATAEVVCHRVGILHQGRLIAEGRPDELREKAAGSDLESIFLELTREAADP
jgi:ABC-2 type transport system ATP-binding protein